VKRKNKFFAICIAALIAILPVKTQVGAMIFSSENEYEYYVDLMSHLIVGEVEGCDRQMKEYVGSVVLNRVKSSKFPESIEGVIFQEGQYRCTWDGNFEKSPSQEDIEVATDLLLNGSKLPEDVLYQAEFVQGPVYISLTAPNGVTEYFCYG
jgi:hypothetical protein